jgi:hypothetical protein
MVVAPLKTYATRVRDGDLFVAFDLPGGRRHER